LGNKNKPNEREKTMKVQLTDLASKSKHVFQFAKRIVLSRTGKVMLVVAVVGCLASIPRWTVAGDQNQNGQDDNGADGSVIQQGFAIAPVPLDLRGKNRALVGLGSYIVNTGGCNDCHTVPPYAPGHDPFLGEQPPQINVATYLGGGDHFGPFISRNITPDANGLPAGLTRDQFITALSTGIDKDGQILQVMPWPVFGLKTDRDLKAIYEYLSSIPSLPGPGPRNP
jgi:hypothetical protein